MENSCELIIRVTPRANREEIVGEQEGQWRVRLTAPPVEGAANEALLAFLSKRLGVPRTALIIRSGRTGRLKRVRIVGLTEAEARRRLSGEKP